MPLHRFNPSDVDAKERELRARIDGAQPAPRPSFWRDLAEGILVGLGLCFGAGILVAVLEWVFG